jgi:hypothetical protein
MLGGDSLRSLVAAVSATALAYQDHWVVASFVVVLVAGVSLIGWDVRRAEGLAAWAKELVAAAGRWDRFRYQRKKLRDAQRTQHLLERNKRRQIRRRNRKGERKKGVDASRS